MKYQELTQKIIGAGMKVHCSLGNGFQEVIYQRALAIEFNELKLIFQREQEMKIFYKNQMVGKRRVDFLVEDKIIVELKAIGQLENTHLVQTLNYLEAYNLEIGLLLNFGTKSLEFKRIHNNKILCSLLK